MVLVIKILIFLYFFFYTCSPVLCVFFFQAEDGIRDGHVTGVQTCALPISSISSTCARTCTTSPPPRWASTTWTTTCATSRITGTRTRGRRAASLAAGARRSERELLRHEILEARHDLAGQELHG